MKNKPRVILISGQSSDSGCWLLTQYLGRSLEKAGHEVTYIKPLKSRPLMLDLLISIPINTLKAFFIPADVIMGIKPFPHVTLPLMLKKLVGTKTVVHIDDLDYGYRGGFLSWLSKRVQRPFPRRIDLVTYHNPNLRKHIVEDLDVDEGSLYVLEQGVDLDTFDYRKNSDVSTRNALKSKYGIRSEKILFYTGHLNIASDLDDILRVFKLVRNSRRDIKLLVAGGGPSEEHFVKLAGQLGVAKQVIFTGYLSKEDVAALITVADVCLVYYKDIPVSYYRCSMKLRECMGMEKPVVCNDVGDLRRFRHYTYQSSTRHRAFADKVLQVLEEGPDKRVRAGRVFIQKSLDWNRLGRSFSKRISRLMKES
jgi:glycosyltransferase involved in cell wall biosynthesis